MVTGSSNIAIPQQLDDYLEYVKQFFQSAEEGAQVGGKKLDPRCYQVAFQRYSVNVWRNATVFKNNPAARDEALKCSYDVGKASAEDGGDDGDVVGPEAFEIACIKKEFEVGEQGLIC